jgi:hypothetical protein
MPHSTTLRLIAIASISFALTACVGQNESTLNSNSGVGFVLGSPSSNDTDNNAVNETPVVHGVSSTLVPMPVADPEPTPADPVTGETQPEPEDTTLTLTWKADTETLDGYLVYYGSTPETATHQISDIKAYAGSFDFAAPALQYASYYDLGLQPGNSICFKVRAYNANGMSDWSEAVCGVIPKKSA